MRISACRDGSSELRESAAGRGWREAVCPPEEEGGRGQLRSPARRTSHLTRSDGRRGEGGRVQAEDAHLQKR